VHAPGYVHKSVRVNGETSEARQMKSAGGRSDRAQVLQQQIFVAALDCTLVTGGKATTGGTGRI